MSSATIEQVNAADVSLSEFVTLLVLELDQKGITMPFQNEEKWHRLFYSFKADKNAPGRPAFLERLRFDWDGRYPRAVDLSECLQTLHWNGFMSVANPSYDKLSVDQDVKQDKEAFAPTTQDSSLLEFISASANSAQKFFS